MARWVMLVIVVVAACDSKKQTQPAESKPAEAPLPITFGDCAAPTVAFVSGPRPLPFTAADADQTWMAKADPPPVPDSAQDDPPPPEDEPSDDESGGTGTTMALDEGKMGRRDSDRVVGQYRMKRMNDDDPQLARQQAIEAARKAGILGSARVGRDDDSLGGLLGNEVGEMHGGFGFSSSGDHVGFGYGPMALPPLGRYGTIGYGSGTGMRDGFGPGGMRNGRLSLPTVTAGQPSVVGDLDTPIVRRYLKRNYSKFSYCFEKQLLVKPDLAGLVSTTFFISPSGAVTKASASGLDPTVASCVENVIKGIQFPQPRGGGGVQVSYSLTLTPPEAAAPKQPPPAPPRPLFRVGAQGPVDDAGYAPGKTNPLRAEQAALVACLRKSPTRAGVGVVELAYAGPGTVDKAVVHGIADDATRTCIAEAAKRVKRTGSAAAERCSFAFGEQPASELPALEIAGTRAKLVGGTVKLDVEVATDIASTPEIIAAIVDRVKAASAPELPVVTTHGPLVLRAPAATPMDLVDRTIASVIAGGDDFVLAVQDDKGWALLAPMTLPVVPVPYGTGGRWNHTSSSSRPAATKRPTDDDERVVLSVLVGKEHVYVGLSTGDVRRIPVADAASKLGAILKSHKARPELAKRADLEIAGDGEATYGAFAQAVQQAIGAGFTEWQHVPPARLTARFTE